MNLKKSIKKIFEKWGINPTIVLQFKYGDAFKYQQRLVPHPKIIFDIGAFDGRTAMKYNGIFPKALIYSFEPTKESFGILSKISNKITNIIPIQLAISDQVGKVTFHINKSGLTNSIYESNDSYSNLSPGMNTIEQISVDCETLDHFCEQNKLTALDILKMDVQGAELKVLHGASNMLQQKKIKLIFMEVEYAHLYNGQPLFHHIASFLEKHDYSLFSIYNLSFDKRNGQLIYSDAIFISNDYIHNPC